jgi:KaiC/GvpD/RAD55 family RecA-like ATPase
MSEKKIRLTNKIDFSKIKAAVNRKIKECSNYDLDLQSTKKTKLKPLNQKLLTPKEIDKKNYVLTGVTGFDELLKQGIPKNSNVIIAGGTGSGKTIFCLQTLMYHASQGKKCFYMSFEETEERLIEHMKDFGWNPDELIKSGNLKIKKYLPTDIHYFDSDNNVEAMFVKDEDSQLIELEPISLQLEFKVDFIVLDSLTAVASAFKENEQQSYRFYVERLFNFFQSMGSTNFLITETKQIPDIFSPTGVEEFLADGVIVIYNIKRENIRERAIEILKMRGVKHQEKIVAMKITDNGIVVYPGQEVFGGV